jgi:hypothetical protein
VAVRRKAETQIGALPLSIGAGREMGVTASSPSLPKCRNRSFQPLAHLGGRRQAIGWTVTQPATSSKISITVIDWGAGEAADTRPAQRVVALTHQRRIFNSLGSCQSAHRLGVD